MSDDAPSPPLTPGDSGAEEALIHLATELRGQVNQRLFGAGVPRSERRRRGIVGHGRAVGRMVVLQPSQVKWRSSYDEMKSLRHMPGAVPIRVDRLTGC